ncbi:hypothetical protein [Hoylesella nanceiensis]|nr:hypothetical protein [Hoylesella nanceiensis]
MLLSCNYTAIMVQKLCFYEISIHHIAIDISLQGKESDYVYKRSI